MNLKKAAIYYSENYDKVDHFTIDFSSNPYGGCNFVTLNNLDELINYNNEMNNMSNKNNNMKENKKNIMLNESNKSKYMMSKLGKRITQMIGQFVNSKEDEGRHYTREDIINGIKSSTDILAKKYPAVTDKFVINCIDYFIKSQGDNLYFLIEGRKKKNNILNENMIKKIVAEAVKKVLNERDWRFDMMSNRGTQQDKIQRANSSMQQQYGVNNSQNFGNGTLYTNVNANIGQNGEGYLSNNQAIVKNGNVDNSRFLGQKFEKGNGQTAQYGNSYISDNGMDQYNKAHNDMQDYYSGNFQNRMANKMKKLGNYNVMPDMGQNFRQPQQQMSESTIRRIVSESIKNVLKKNKKKNK